MLAASPKACSARDKDGFLPLHLALMDAEVRRLFSSVSSALSPARPLTLYPNLNPHITFQFGTGHWDLTHTYLTVNYR
jgi:hypothetical protein